MNLSDVKLSDAETFLKHTKGDGATGSVGDKADREALKAAKQKLDRIQRQLTAKFNAEVTRLFGPKALTMTPDDYVASLPKNERKDARAKIASYHERSSAEVRAATDDLIQEIYRLEQRLKHSESDDNSFAHFSLDVLWLAAFEENIEHSGVKGMKWGVRHNPVTKGEKKAFAAATNDMNKKYISQLNNTSKYAGKDLTKSAKLRKEYELDAENLFTRVYAAHLNRVAVNSQMKSRVATGVVLSSAAATIRYALYYAAMAQADTREKAQVVNLQLTLNELGQIESITELSTEDGFFEPDPLVHGDTFAAFLEQHAEDVVQSGIRGMKWGVRRKPGPDGTVSSSPDAQRAAASLAAIKKAKSTSALSDDDLNHLTKRLGLEKKLSELDAGLLGKTNRQTKRLLDYGETMNKAISFANSDAGRLLAVAIGQKSAGKHVLPGKSFLPTQRTSQKK